MAQLHIRRLGSGAPFLLLLHGLGTNGATWQPAASRIAAHVSGTILIPDLRGHGFSPHMTHYSYALHAADVVDCLPADAPFYVIGHSMGGAVALALASGWFARLPEAVFAFSVKTGFSEAELQRSLQYASSPAKVFATREEAVNRYLKVAGLDGIVAAHSEMASAGITQAGAGYRLAADPRTVLVATGVDVARLYAELRCPCAFAGASNDVLAPVGPLREIVGQVHEIEGCGHNAHVENPDRFAALAVQWLASLGATKRPGAV